MKKIFLTSLTLIASAVAFAAVHTVSNAPSNPSQFNNLQAAQDAAAAGDTLLVDATGLSYGNLTVNKQLHIYGAKSLPGQGPKINTLVLSSGAASGSSFHSLHLDVVGTDLTDAEALNYVTFRRCHIGYVGLETTGTAVYSYWLFDANVFYENLPLVSFYINDNQDILSFSTFQYNIFNSSITGVENSLFDHNIFTGLLNSNVMLNNIYTSTFSNNIFYGISTANGQYCNNNAYLNNLSYGGSTTAFPIGEASNTGSGNIQNSDPIFQNAPINVPYSVTHDYHLLSGSLGLGNGSDDENIGIHDSTISFRMDGEPDIPVVRSVSLPGGNTVPAEGTFQISINSVSHP